jgi:hypothetical protein
MTRSGLGERPFEQCPVMAGLVAKVGDRAAVASQLTRMLRRQKPLDDFAHACFYFCAQGTCLAPIHWTSGADRRRVARCGFMSSFGSLYCRSLTWCLALLISRQSLMCGGPRRSRVFSRNERAVAPAQGAAIVWLSSAGAWPCQVGARKAVRMLSPEWPNDSTHGLGGFRERPPSAIVHAVVTMA